MISCKEKNALDVVGHYEVTICGKTYDTILVIDVESCNDGIMTQTYLDINGRTVLWRRFNKDDWAFKSISKSGLKDCRKTKRSVLMAKPMSIGMTVSPIMFYKLAGRIHAPS
jgi:hypothetical protein